jgi:hypothetical protein
MAAAPVSIGTATALAVPRTRRGLMFMALIPSVLAIW